MRTFTSAAARSAGSRRFSTAKGCVGVCLLAVGLWSSLAGWWPTAVFAQDLAAVAEPVAPATSLARQLRPLVPPAAVRPLRELIEAARSGNSELAVIMADRLLAIDSGLLLPLSDLPKSLNGSREATIDTSTSRAVWRLRREWFRSLTPRQQTTIAQTMEPAAEQAHRELPTDETRGERLIAFARRFDLTRPGLRAWEELAAGARDVGRAELAAAIHSDLAAHPLLTSNGSLRTIHRARAEEVLAEFALKTELASMSIRPEQAARRLALLAQLQSRNLDDSSKSPPTAKTTLKSPTNATHELENDARSEHWDVPLNPVWDKLLAPARWRYRARGVAMLSLLQPAVGRDVVIVHDPLQFTARDRRTGALRWELASPLLRADAFDGASLNAAEWATLVAVEQSHTLHTRVTLDDDRFYFVERAATRADGRPPHRLLCAAGTETGQILWRLGGKALGPTYPLSDSLFLGPPLVIDEQLVFLAEKDQTLWLHVAGREHGALEWSLPLGQLGQPPAANPVLQRAAMAMVWDGTHCVVTTGLGEVISIHLPSRAIDWMSTLPPLPQVAGTQRVDLPPGYSPDNWWHGWREARLIVTTRGLVGVSPETNDLSAWSFSGEKRWSISLPEGVALIGSTGASHAVKESEKKSVIVTTTNGLRAYNLADGRLRWVLDDLEQRHAWLSGLSALYEIDNPSSPDENVVVVAPLTDGRQLVVSPATGRVLAIRPEPNPAGASSRESVALKAAVGRLWSLSPQRLISQAHVLPGGSPADDATLFAETLRKGDFRAAFLLLEKIPAPQRATRFPETSAAQVVSILRENLIWREADLEQAERQRVARLLAEYLPLVPERRVHETIELADFWLANGDADQALRLLASLTLADLAHSDEATLALDLSALMTAGKTLATRVSPGGSIHPQRARPSRRALAIALRVVARIATDPTSPAERVARYFPNWIGTDPALAKQLWAGTSLGSELALGHELTTGLTGSAPQEVDTLGDELAHLAMIDRLEAKSLSEASPSTHRLEAAWRGLSDGWRKRGLKHDAEAAETLSVTSLQRGTALRASRPLPTTALEELLPAAMDNALDESAKPSTPTPPESTPGLVLPSVRERNEEVYQIPVPITSWPGFLGDRLDVSIARSGAAFRFVGEGVESPWTLGLIPDDIETLSPLRHVWQLHAATGCGRLLVMQVGTELMAVQPLNDAGEPQPKLLWSLELAGPKRMPGEPLMPLYRVRKHLADAPPLGVVDQYGNALGAATLITPELTAWISGGMLEVIDTATGIPRWSRSGIPPLAQLAGDADTVIVVDVTRQRIALHDGLDGTLLEERSLSGKLPPQADSARRKLYARSVVGETPRGWWIDGRHLYREVTAMVERPPAAPKFIKAYTPPRDPEAPPEMMLRYQLICHDLVTGRDLWQQSSEILSYAFPLDAWTLGLVRPTSRPGLGEILLIDARTGAARGPAIPTPFPEKISRIVATQDRDRFYVGLSNGAAMRQESAALQLRSGYRQPYLNGEMVAIGRRTGDVAWRVAIDQEPWPLDISRAYPLIIRCWTTPESPGNRGAVGHQRIHWAGTGETASADDALFLNGYVTIEPGEGRELLLRREFYTTRVFPPGK